MARIRAGTIHVIRAIRRSDFGSGLDIARIADLALQRRYGDGAGRAEVMAGFGMAVTSREISGLIGDHYLFFAHGSHVHGLIGACAWWKDSGARIHQRFKQTLA